MMLRPSFEQRFFVAGALDVEFDDYLADTRRYSKRAVGVANPGGMGVTQAFTLLLYTRHC